MLIVMTLAVLKMKLKYLEPEYELDLFFLRLSLCVLDNEAL